MRVVGLLLATVNTVGSTPTRWAAGPSLKTSLARFTGSLLLHQRMGPRSSTQSPSRIGCWIGGWIVRANSWRGLMRRMGVLLVDQEAAGSIPAVGSTLRGLPRSSVSRAPEYRARPLATIRLRGSQTSPTFLQNTTTTHRPERRAQHEQVQQ